MDPSINVNGTDIGLVLLIVLQFCLIWYRLGKLEGKVDSLNGKNSNPGGSKNGKSDTK